MPAARGCRPCRRAPAPAQIAVDEPALQTPLVPNSPIQTTAASFGTDVTEPVTFDPRLQSYVIRHYQATGATRPARFRAVHPAACRAARAAPAENR